MSEANDNTKQKGAFNGPCNRTACQAPGAVWWNTSTRAYYCRHCARILTRENGVGLMVLHEVNREDLLSAAPPPSRRRRPAMPERAREGPDLSLGEV